MSESEVDIESLSLEQLQKRRRYLEDVGLDGDNGEGDDGLENWEDCNKAIEIVDARIKRLKALREEIWLRSLQ